MKWAQLAWLHACIAFSTGIALVFLGPNSHAWPWAAVIFVATGIGACACVALAMASFIDEIETLRLIARQRALGHPTDPNYHPELPEAS